MSHRILSALALLLILGHARAELVSLDIHTREPFAGGKSFGEVGPYERLIGVAKFAVDPDHARNKHIVDLSLAPRNDKGKVEFSADVFILAPKDPSKGNGAILYDVNNRGNKLALGMFNSAAGSNDPTTEKDAGNGFLFRRGYTVVWCGWIGELLSGANRLLLKAPVATENGKPITGTVRFEMGTDAAAESLPISRREGHGSYTPTTRGEKEGVLTWRMREADRRVEIPRNQWSLERKEIVKVEKTVPGTLPQIRLHLKGGFRPGYIYELVCECEGPIVQGTGFAATRDLIAFLKHNTTKDNPLSIGGKKSAIDRAHAFGVSQSGRFLRHLLYQGFNVDEKERRVFDGLMPHVAGGGLGFFNHRFAQPTRHNGQHEDHLYPCDIFPFSYGKSLDLIRTSPTVSRSRGMSHGILKGILNEDEKLLPKVMHTQSAAEYWHRAGSLVHTTTIGTDTEIPQNVRIYSFGGTQHGPASKTPSRGAIAENLLNPGDYKPQLRALLDALDAWVKDGTAPPASVYPTIKDGTLVNWDQKSAGFPSLPGVRYPEVIQQPPALDLGENFVTKGVIKSEPPTVVGHYVVLVPKSDADGNDLGCLSPLEVAVPLATYTGWNLRRREVGAEGMLANLAGSYIPFPGTEVEREKTGDPRHSLEKRYTNFDGYVKRFKAQAEHMVKARHLLQEDADRMTAELASSEKLFSPRAGK